MKTKKQVLIPAFLIVAVFAAILSVATFYDLQISDFLTKDALTDGTYNTNQWFAATFQVIGNVPVYLGFAIAFHILFLNGLRNFAGAKKYIFMFIPAVLAVVAYYVMVSDIFRYMKEILLMRYTYFASPGGFYKTAVILACAMGLTILGTLATNNLSSDTLKRLFVFAFALIIVAAIPTILINLVLKNPIGRFRYRAMKMYADDPVYGFASYTRWYEWKGQWIDEATMYMKWGTDDVLRSCPSGHTAAAATSYGLIMINDALGIKNKKIRALNWALPIIWTGLVATARIVAGAHFLSDVLLGGSLTFITMIITREIMICKGANIKAVFGKKN